MRGILGTRDVKECGGICSIPVGIGSYRRNALV